MPAAATAMAARAARLTRVSSPLTASERNTALEPGSRSDEPDEAGSP